MVKLTKKKTKSISSPCGIQGRARNISKAKAKKEEILADARTIFTKYPYNKASLRLICEKTGSNHNLIRYHFGSKAKLFEELINLLIAELETVLHATVKDIDNFPPQASLALFIKQYLDFGFSHPDSMTIIMHNIGSYDDSEFVIPGLALLKSIVTNTQHVLKKNFSIKATEKELSMWIFGFTMATICSIGSAESLMLIANLEKKNKTYRQFVEISFNAAFFPSFLHLLNGSDSDAFEDLKVFPTKAGVFDQLKQIIPEPTPSVPKTKGEITRNQMVQAAQNVFSKLPYEVCSIRMIGKDGNFDFAQIRNYFPKKESLFFAVVKELFNEFVRDVLLVYEGLEKIKSVMETHNLATKRLLAHCYKNKQSLSLIVQNAARIGNIGTTLPGLDYIQKFITTIVHVSSEIETMKAPDKEMRIFLVFKILIYINSVGAATCYAKLYNMEPESKRYQQWVYDTYIFLVYPKYRDMILTYGVETADKISKPFT